MELEELLERAEEAARKGEPDMMEFYLGKARGAGIHEGAAEKIKQIEKLGYQKGTRVALEMAEKFVNLGKPREVERYIKEAKKYAEKARIDISKKTSKLQQLANAYGFPPAYKKLKEAVIEAYTRAKKGGLERQAAALEQILKQIGRIYGGGSPR